MAALSSIGQPIFALASPAEGQSVPIPASWASRKCGGAWGPVSITESTKLKKLLEKKMSEMEGWEVSSYSMLRVDGISDV